MEARRMKKPFLFLVLLLKAKGNPFFYDLLSGYWPQDYWVPQYWMNNYWPDVS
jgi:hypothetical protein